MITSPATYYLPRPEDKTKLDPPKATVTISTTQYATDDSFILDSTMSFSLSLRFALEHSIYKLASR